MSDPKDLVPVQVTSHLNHREEAALRAHQQSREPGLAPTKSAELFELYLKGASLEQISRLNYPSLRLGQIVSAWRDGDWYGRRESYRQGLYEGIQERVKQTQAEGINFLADFMSVAHKDAGQRFQRYLQTGDITELGDFRPMSLGAYKVAFELLMKATGQDGKKVSGKVEHEHSVKSLVEGEVLEPGEEPMTTEQAMSFLLNAK